MEKEKIIEILENWIKVLENLNDKHNKEELKNLRDFQSLINYQKSEIEMLKTWKKFYEEKLYGDGDGLIGDCEIK